MSLLSAADIDLTLGGRQILERVDLGISAGEVLGLIGPNGAGKTSLIRVLAGLQHADAGSVRWQGQNLSSLSRRKRARAIGYLPQAAPLHWELSVRTLVELGRLPWRHAWQQDRRGPEAVNDALRAAELEELAERRVSTLSGGERMRVMLARLLASEPALLLADEPVAALDLAHQLHVMRLLREQASAGRGVIAVLHDLSLAARFCDRLLLLDRGRVAASGVPADVLDPGLLSRCYGVKVRRIEQDGALLLVPWAAPGEL